MPKFHGNVLFSSRPVGLDKTDVLFSLHSNREQGSSPLVFSVTPFVEKELRIVVQSLSYVPAFMLTPSPTKLGVYSTCFIESKTTTRRKRLIKDTEFTLLKDVGSIKMSDFYYIES